MADNMQEGHRYKQWQTRASIYVLDEFAGLDVPQADLTVEAAWRRDGALFVHVHRDHAELVTFNSVSQL